MCLFTKKTKYFVFSQFIKFFYKLRTRRTIIFFKNYIEIILIIYFFLMLLLICTFVYLSYSILLFTILFDYCWDNQFLYYFIICWSFICKIILPKFIQRNMYIIYKRLNYCHLFSKFHIDINQCLLYLIIHNIHFHQLGTENHLNNVDKGLNHSLL